MRRAFNNVEFIEENGILYGISLGSDFCAEHEWGIEDMRGKFGITDKGLGYKSRKITKAPILFKEEENLSVLRSSDFFFEIKESYTAKDLLSHDIKSMSNNLETAWDGRGFCIATKNEADFPKLRELYQAFVEKNILITFLQSEISAFSNASLSILILDKLPKELTEQMYFVDKKAKDLIDYEEKIGVAKLKRKTRGKGYQGEKYFMACSPRWINYEDEKAREESKKKIGTKYDIQFWVNYSDDDNHYGWHTAEEIIEWLSTPNLKLKQIYEKRK